MSIIIHIHLSNPQHCIMCMPKLDPTASAACHVYCAQPLEV